jgi:hypothetical protein
MSAATNDPFKGPEQTTSSKGTPPKDSKARNAAYSEAVADLKATYPDAWADAYRTALEKRGLEYVVRLTPAERAEKEKAEAQAKAIDKIAALIKEHGLEETWTVGYDTPVE